MRDISQKMMAVRWLEAIDQKTPFGLKLAGAFATVIVVGVISAYWLLQDTMVATFEEYSAQTSILHAQGMTPFFAYYYEKTGNWQGVERLLAAMSSAHGPLGEHLVLANTSGSVLGPSDSHFNGQTLSQTLLDRGAPIMVDGQRVGTLFANLGTETPPLLANRFLDSIRRSIFGAGGAAAGIALILGFLVIRQLTRPLRTLSSATHRFAAGQLHHRVKIYSKDVIGQLGSDFNTMAQKLAKSEGLRQQMMADIAHELRTPLTVLQGNLQGLREGVFDPTPEFLTSLHEESLLLRRLVNDLQELSLAEAGELYLNKVSQPIGPLLDRALKALTQPIQDNHIVLQQRVAADLPPLRADSDRIVQVLVNLLSNAIRHTPRGGSITLQAKQVDLDIQVSITDTGAGIDQSDLPFVFERFWRADRARGRRNGGSGLGLAITKNLIEIHGGTIQVKSDKGVGTTFTFTLPIEENHVQR